MDRIPTDLTAIYERAVSRLKITKLDVAVLQRQPQMAPRNALILERHGTGRVTTDLENGFKRQTQSTDFKLPLCCSGLPSSHGGMLSRQRVKVLHPDHLALGELSG